MNPDEKKEILKKLFKDYEHFNGKYKTGGIVSGGSHSSSYNDHVHLNLYKHAIKKYTTSTDLPHYKPVKLTHLQGLREKFAPDYSHHLMLTHYLPLSGLSGKNVLRITHPDGTYEIPYVDNFVWKRWEDFSLPFDVERFHAEFYSAPGVLLLECTGVILLESTVHTQTLESVELFGNECLCANSESLFG